MGVARWMRAAEFRPDAGCRRGMRDAGWRGERRVSGEKGEGRDRTGRALSLVHHSARIPNPAQHSILLPHPVFLFCTLHRVEIPQPASISPLTSAVAAPPWDRRGGIARAN